MFVPGKLYGIRAWELCVDSDGALRLGGFFQQCQWRMCGETTWAQCVVPRSVHSKPPHKGPAPGGSCSCGLYAMHPWAARDSGILRPDPEHKLWSVGIVEAWGSVQLHTAGFRAQYARPAALAVLGTRTDSDYGRLIERLADMHRADLLAFESLADLVEHCSKEGLGMSEAAVSDLLQLP